MNIKLFVSRRGRVKNSCLIAIISIIVLVNDVDGSTLSFSVSVVKRLRLNLRRYEIEVTKNSVAIVAVSNFVERILKAVALERSVPENFPIAFSPFLAFPKREEVGNRE